MTRWNETCVLVAEGVQEQAADGSWRVADPIGSEAYCNPYTVSLDAWTVSNRDLGLRADAEIQLRSRDYGGQQTVLYRGNEYAVEKVTDSGEFVRLQLGRRARNV